MVVFPFAKVNLGLNVVRRRSDGYHDIESILYPIPLEDMLEAVLDGGLPDGELHLSHSGLPVPGDPGNDLCQRAYRTFHAAYPLPGVRAHLHKMIPMGAGLGGGSSDATHMLMLLNELVGRPLDHRALHELAASLGSDCPFFLERRARAAVGRGEVLSPVDVDLTGWTLVLLHPPVHVPTPEAYRLTRPSGRYMDLETAVGQPVRSWGERLLNGMEEGVFKAHPVIGDLKRSLLAAGAVHAAMSGSGSCVFGLFTDPPGRIDHPDDGVDEWRWLL